MFSGRKIGLIERIMPVFWLKKSKKQAILPVSSGYVT